MWYITAAPVSTKAPTRSVPRTSGAPPPRATLRRRLLLARDGANPDNPTDEDWKAAVPLQPWRDRIRELYESALKAGKGG